MNNKLLVGLLIGLSACAPDKQIEQELDIPAFDEVAYLASTVDGLNSDYSCRCIEDDNCSDMSATLEMGYLERSDGNCEWDDEASVLKCTFEQRFVDVLGDIESPGEWQKVSFHARRVLDEEGTSRWCLP